MHKILVVCGPTATGKTALAIKLAHRFGGELIAADSRQIYRGMDIGTGKDIQGIFGYDLVDPDQPYSAAAFARYAWGIIYKLWAKGRLPILVGGTGLYLHQLFHPAPTAGLPPNPALRHQLAKVAVPALQARLQSLNLSRFNLMNSSDRQNPRRLIRAIEVAEAGSAVNRLSGTNPPAADSQWIGLQMPLKQLDAAINARVRARATPAFTQEIETLLRLYPEFLTYPAASATGYREWAAYLKGDLTRDQAITLWQLRERQYARRQLTWFRKRPQIHWFDPTLTPTQALIVEAVKTWYAKS